jgi:acetoin utilization protein AcuB
MNTETPVKRIKTSKIIYVGPYDSLLKIEEVFDAMPIHHILVVEHNILHGIISKHDLLKVYRGAVDAGILPDRSSILAKDVMTTDPITLDTEDTIGLAADIILTNQIHSIPVLNGDQLSGIITNHDILKYCFKL